LWVGCRARLRETDGCVCEHHRERRVVAVVREQEDLGGRLEVVDLNTGRAGGRSRVGQ
jgi:hypothetical protein